MGVNRSAIVKEILPDSGDFVAYVRRIDDQSLELLRRRLPAGAPVHLWSPESLDGISEIVASEMIVTSTYEVGIGPLYRLSPKVRTLILNGNTCKARSLRINAIEHVEDLAVGWEYVDFESSLSPNLRRLSLFGYSPPSIESLPTSGHLRELCLYSARKIPTLAGIERYTSLAHLEVNDGYKLTDISAIAETRHLKLLDFDGCSKIRSLDAVAHCRDLTRLGIANCGLIESLGPLRDHPCLEELWASGSTRIADNDLLPLLSLSHLRALALASRRGYRPSCRDVEEALNIEE